MALRPIVAGVDGSEESLRAAEWAALEAGRHSAPLRIVSVPALLPRMHTDSHVPASVAGLLYDESRRALAEAVTRVNEIAPGQLVDAELLTGSPAVTVARSGSGASMLVLGARGSGGFAAMVLGSVSRYAAMHARCPVVVVREETGAVHREVVVGIRDPRDADATLAYAFDEAELRGAALIAVHSCNWPHAGLRETADTERSTAQADLDLTEALRPWRDKYPAVLAWQDVVHDHPAHALASYSARADLVVIGRHDDRPGAHPAVGGIQHALLSHARGPVAIVPAME
ncbi:MAG TPA: universal stress protein [Trebonia sp.]|nr:universal stress protein [Trebonia sp.]